MYQTLQCTGLMWVLTLIIPQGESKRLAYVRSLDDAMSRSVAGLPVRVLPDATYLQYMTLIRRMRGIKP
jgi:hypothetical protein